MGLVKCAVLATFVLLSACQTKPEPIADQTPGPYGLPPKDTLVAMLKNPITRPLAMQMVLSAQRMQAGLPPYPGNCPTDWNYDAAGHRCGARSAMSRPGGYY